MSASHSHTHSHEEHFTATDVVRDVVIGMADGLTVPFALAAGISGAVDSINIIVTAGLAEIAAGAISMGLGGYLAARTYHEHYDNERMRELYEIDRLTERERQETRDIFKEYGLDGPAVESVVELLEKDKERWADFMMRFELNLNPPQPNRAAISAFTIGGAYVIGGLVPLSGYMVTMDIKTALLISSISTLSALAIFGAIKAKLTGSKPIKGAAQTMFVGGVAAAVAYWIATLIAH